METRKEWVGRIDGSQEGVEEGTGEEGGETFMIFVPGGS